MLYIKAPIANAFGLSEKNGNTWIKFTLRHETPPIGKQTYPNTSYIQVTLWGDEAIEHAPYIVVGNIVECQLSKLAGRAYVGKDKTEKVSIDAGVVPNTIKIHSGTPEQGEEVEPF